MVKILGNSSQRVVINDLGDVIYYRQKKEYTDQEYEKSRDLKREIGARRLLVLETHNVRNSLPESVAPEPARTSSLNLKEIKKVVSEAISEHKQDTGDLVPTLINAIRQEISGMTVQGLDRAETKKLYETPTYVPEIKMGDLKSNINIESKQVEGDLSDSLEALKNLQSK